MVESKHAPPTENRKILLPRNTSRLCRRCLTMLLICQSGSDSFLEGFKNFNRMKTESAEEMNDFLSEVPRQNLVSTTC